MIPWWQGRLVAFDLETTGTNVESARIVTAAVVHAGAGLAPETLALLADPGIEIPQEASDVHGITTERAQAEGLPAVEVLTAVRIVLAQAIDAGLPLVMSNARFDLTVLDRELRRHDLGPLPDPLVVDVLVLDKWLDRYRKGSRRLDALCEHYGATLTDAHAADADALAAARVAWCIGKRGLVVRRAWNDTMKAERAVLEAEWESVRHDLPALHRAQVGWAAEQAEGLRSHFIAQGKADDAASVRLEWPLIPAPAILAANKS